jgi:flagellar biosynthesis protein FlhF
MLYKNPVYQNPSPYTGGAMEPQPSYNVEKVSDEEKIKILAAAGKSTILAAGNKEAAINDEKSELILESIKEIKEIIGREAGRRYEEHSAFIHATELLKLNDFSENYINGMLEKLRKELPLEKLDNMDVVEDTLLEWIGESINIYKHDGKSPKSKVMVLVGPTGVGKTTTIAKLAAVFGIGNSEKPGIRVRMVTIDAYRIGARAQLEKYGDLMEIPVSFVDNKQDLRKEIALFNDETDLFLVDTIGKSPKDLAKLGEIKEILEGCPKGTEIHLVLSSGTKVSDIENIIRQFEPFNYISVLVTKLDETDHIGNVISALAEKGKSVSYITDGQKVQNDIRRASVVRFLINLEGFKVNRDKMEKRFPVGEADQFKWG